MRTLNIRGALVFSAIFLALAWVGSVCFPSDTDVRFSAASGFYDEPIVLEMTCAVPGVDIFYTTDGSVPTARSYYYDGPITLYNAEEDYHTLSDYLDISTEEYAPSSNMKKANVIRAAAFRGEERLGEVSSGTYFIGIDREDDYGEAAIVSLMMEEDDLFDYETGIYTLGMAYDEWYAVQGTPEAALHARGNFDYRGREWERPVQVEFFPADSQEAGFSQGMGVRIMGGGSREQAHKSLRLTARDEYGQDRVKYALFENNRRADGAGYAENSYKSFALRSGGTDCHYAKIRDPLIQALAQELRMDTQQTFPCVVFINGEYWGLYACTEQYGAHYIEANYSIQKENAVIVKVGRLEAGQESDLSLYQEMLAFICSGDMSDPDAYAQASAMMDMGSFADFMALQLYVDNVDLVERKDNNWQMWRARTIDSSNRYGDGRWRMMLYDVDYTADILGAGWGYNRDSLSPLLEEGPSELRALFRSLCKSADFLRELAISLCDVRNIHFAPPRFNAEMSALRSAYEPLMPDSLERFGPQSIVDWDVEAYCESELDQLEHYFEGRYEIFLQIMQQALHLQSPASLHLSCDGDGAVMVNHSVPDMQQGYTGLYFPDYPITLTALETGEGCFVRWEGEGCEIADPHEVTTEVTFGGDFSVRAVFE